MAKKKTIKGPSSVDVNSYSKGMMKDLNPSLEPKDMWTHARNVKNNSVDGDVALIGNEPANLKCATVPYTIIGAIHKYGDEWVVFSTDDTNSEIGLFDDSKCEYTQLINDACLNFNRQHLITGAAKENFDCTWQIYFDDGLNPSRTINIDDIPYIQQITSAPGDPCIIYEDAIPLQLDCEKIRLAPLLDKPCIELDTGQGGGQLRNGAYQAYVAYVLNEQRVTDYLSASNIQTIFHHDVNSGSLDVHITNLDKEFEFYELVILSDNQGQKVAKKMGIYSTEQSLVSIDYIDQSLSSIPIELLFLKTPAYEKSDSMYVVNDILIRQGPTEQFDFNYQPLANDIQTEWVSIEYDETYYYDGGNKYGFLRDEQYAFFIRWIYNTGEKSASYHIPGRAPKTSGFVGNGETSGAPFSNGSELDTSATPFGNQYNFQIYNTATVTGVNMNTVLPDGGKVIAKGQMGYWQSTEKYPATRPDIWADLCGEHIRHHKIPSEEVTEKLELFNETNNTIRVVGVQFKNIKRPRFNDGSIIPNIIGYEILRGSREGNKSILAKGVFRNFRKYEIPERSANSDLQGLYPNYPYNDLRKDVYFHDGTGDSGGFSLVEILGSNNVTEPVPRTDGCESSFTDSLDNFPPLKGYTKDVFTFHSGDLMFKRPFLNTPEARIYGSVHGDVEGYFIKSEEHPKNKLLRNQGAIVAGLIGIGYALKNVRGAVSRTTENTLFPAYKINTVGPNSVVDVGNPLAYGATLATGLAGYLALSLTAGAGPLLQEDLGDVFAFGAGRGALDTFNFLTNIGEGAATLAAAPFSIPPKTILEYDRQGNSANLPNLLQAAVQFAFLNASEIAFGAQEVIDLMYNLVSFEDFAFKFNSSSDINRYNKVKKGELFRSPIKQANYLGSSFQIFGETGEFKVNNLFRPDVVAIQTEEEFLPPHNISNNTPRDKTRYAIGGDADEDFGNTLFKKPETVRTTKCSMLYGALKYDFENQYGQLDGIKQTVMNSCTFNIPASANSTVNFETTPIVDGDTFIGRYTEKVIMPIFTDFLYGQPDQTPYNYLQRINLPYPRFWMDTRKFDTGPLGREIASFGLANSNGQATLPNDLFYLDRGKNTCGGVLGWFSGGAKLNPAFQMRYAYMYTHVNGILSFYTESEINYVNRDWVDVPEKQIYSPFRYNNVDELFDAAIIKFDNFYKYDYSLSPSRFVTNLTTFGNIQPRDYDPLIAETCYTYYPKRLIYSLPAQVESKKDNWRRFLVNNYKDFKSIVNVIKPINQTGAIIFFPYESPKMFVGQDSLVTGLDSEVYIGDGGLFNKEPVNMVNSELPNEYGSCESQRSIMNTPYGFFFISQAQGKIFQQEGRTIRPISDSGLKWWCSKYLPSQLLKQFPELEEHTMGDNPVVGVGCQTIYDITDSIVYFCKKDYRVKSQYVDSMTFDKDSGNFIFAGGNSIPSQRSITGIAPSPNPNVKIGDPRYFDDVSWTLSYDPKAKAWISFHDWHPELALPSINHFLSTKTISNAEDTNKPEGTIWRHNSRCDLYANYYDVEYPFEVEFVANTGQNVNTVRSLEYQLESYVYKGDLFNGCGDDRWHDLDYNFDELIIYNTEQVSGLLRMELNPKEDPINILDYPIVGANDIKVLYSKEEQKYRVNQFWDITNDRGEFTNSEQAIFFTQLNGYIRDLNVGNLNYNKDETQRKKFRHYYNKFILRRRSSGNRKMLLKVSNSKLNLSFR